LILDILDGSPWFYSEWSLPALSIMYILDIYFEIEGCSICPVGEAIVLTHSDDGVGVVL
jgi:hypothetical protein